MDIAVNTGRRQMSVATLRLVAFAASLLALAGALQGCANTSTQSHATPPPEPVTHAAVSPDMVANRQSKPPAVLDGDLYEGKPPPDICYQSWLAPVIAFEPGSSELAPCAIRVLDEGIRTFLQHPNLRIEVAGHADSTENGTHGKALSLRRAQVVYDHLTAHGVPPSMLIGPVGYGSERSLYVDTRLDGSTIDQDAARLNRRVELNVQN